MSFGKATRQCPRGFAYVGRLRSCCCLDGQHDPIPPFVRPHVQGLTERRSLSRPGRCGPQAETALVRASTVSTTEVRRCCRRQIGSTLLIRHGPRRFNSERKYRTASRAANKTGECTAIFRQLRKISSISHRSRDVALSTESPIQFNPRLYVAKVRCPRAGRSRCSETSELTRSSRDTADERGPTGI